MMHYYTCDTLKGQGDVKLINTVLERFEARKVKVDTRTRKIHFELDDDINIKEVIQELEDYGLVLARPYRGYY